MIIFKTIIVLLDLLLFICKRSEDLSKRPTINDIASLLQLTPATVSRALNGSSEISEETKQRVAREAERINYQRNKIASSLRSGKSHLIGVLIPAADHDFFGSIIHGISNLAANRGYDVLIYQSNESYSYEVKGIQAFMSARVDGILASIAKETHDYSHFMQAKERNIPLVFFDRANHELGIPAVVIDDYKGAYTATEHLIKQGYQRIAHVSGPQHIRAFSDRLRGYIGALQANGMQYDPSLVSAGSISIASGKAAASVLLSLPQPPDAIFAVEDFTALGVIKELKERKIKMPEECGVFGFCNGMFSEHITPSLSSIDQRTVLMGEEAFKLVFQMIENRGSVSGSSKIVLEPIPFFRESSIKSI